MSERSSAPSKRAEQLKRWEESETNKQSPTPKAPSKIQFSSNIIFLAACAAGDKEEIDRLLNKRADINTANVDGLTALHQACIDDNLEMVAFLVTRGADVNKRDNEGWTPLHAIASCGFRSIARYLIDHGAKVGIVNYDGELPIDIAESREMEVLLQDAINYQRVDCDKSRNAEIIRLRADAMLWCKNGYVEVQDPKTGGSPLHVAAAKGYLDVLQMLLGECNVDPDPIDYEGWTPLHAAALWGQRDAAACLIEHGSDPFIKNYSGQTCMDLVDPSISTWLSEAILKCPVLKNINNNNTAVKTEKRVENAENENDTPSPPKILKAPGAKPPVARATSPELSTEASNTEEPPSWRRSSSLRLRSLQTAESKENKPVSTNNTPAVDNDTALRRTHSFENDKVKGIINYFNNLINSNADRKFPPAMFRTFPYTASESDRRSSASDSFRTNKPQLEQSISALNVSNNTYRLVCKFDPSREVQKSKPGRLTFLDYLSTLTIEEMRINFRKSLLKKQQNQQNIDIFYQRYRDVTARIKASSCPSIPPLDDQIQKENHLDTTNIIEINEDDVSLRKENESNRVSGTGNAAPTTVRSPTENAEMSNNSTPATPNNQAQTPTKLSPGNIFKNFFKSFVPPVRDDESETQRKAHAKRVRETRRSTQGVTLDELKSAEQLVKKKSSNGTVEAAPQLPQKTEEVIPDKPIEQNNVARSDVSASTTAIIATNAAAGERRPSWRLRVDPTNKFELEDAARVVPRVVASSSADTTVTLPLRRPLSASSANASPPKEDKAEDRDSVEKTSASSPASTQAALNVIQRRRRPKRRSTGVGHVDMDDIINDRAGSVEGDLENDAPQSGAERTIDSEAASNEDKDYKALYETSSAEVRRLRELLATSEQQLRDARSSITRLSHVSQISLSEQGKREKRAMERKLSEMEEELKNYQALQAENQRLKDENGALIRVISKLSK